MYFSPKTRQRSKLWPGHPPEFGKRRHSLRADWDMEERRWSGIFKDSRNGRSDQTYFCACAEQRALKSNNNSPPPSTSCYSNTEYIHIICVHPVILNSTPSLCQWRLRPQVRVVSFYLTINYYISVYCITLHHIVLYYILSCWVVLITSFRALM